MDIITLVQGDQDSHLTPFFLVHAISGTALPYLRLHPLSANNDRPVYGITNPIYSSSASAASFKFPPSLAALAALYLDGITRIQPHGPYLLGGWSMGGMIAMFMAQILQARGEAVAKVIMIDSANPEVFPCFSNAQEHRELAKATYEKTIALAAMEYGQDDGQDAGPPSPIPSPVVSECEGGFDDYLLSRQRRASTWRTYSSDSSTSSLFDSNPSTSPNSPNLSDYSDYSDEDDEHGCDTDEDEQDLDYDDDVEEFEPPELKGFLGHMKTHVHRGLQLIADVRPGDLFTPHKRSHYAVVLIKCRPEMSSSPSLLHPSHAHAHAHAHRQQAEGIMAVMREKSMRWNPSQFRSFETRLFSGDHDGAFAPQYVGELSGILRECLEEED